MAEASTVFYDRRGDIVTPTQSSIIRPRRGVFALAVSLPARAVLFATEAKYPDTLELPGGGIEDGEDLELAVRREWQEEASIDFNMEGPFGEFRQVRNFYAHGYDQFWFYDQTFRLYHYLGPVEMGKKWLNSEDGQTGWEPISSLPQLPINRAHWCAIPKLLAEIAPELSS